MLFPGQGTQTPRMGEPWRGSPSWDVVERAEEALGQSLAPLLLDDADLSRTREAQLAVLLASVLAWEAIRGQVDGPVASPVTPSGRSPPSSPRAP